MKLIYKKGCIKILIAIVCIHIIGISCGRNNLNKDIPNYTSHVNDTISLNLYGISLGDTISMLRERFRNLIYVPLDSLSAYVPIEDNHKIVYENLGISIYTTDTTFIANHIGWQHVDKNGFYTDFPLKNTKHNAKLIYFIKDSKVFQCEMLITSPILDIYGVELSPDDFIKSVYNQYEQKYSNPDSIMLYNRKSRYAATYSIDTDSIIKQMIYENVKESDVLNEYPPSISSSSIWSWKNANIVAEWDFQPYKGRQIWFWVMCHAIRIIYTDLNAVELETRRLENQIEQQRRDSLRHINKIESGNAELLKKQVI